MAYFHRRKQPDFDRQETIERLRSGYSGLGVYIYRPNMLDRLEPKVLVGRPIESETRVAIIADNRVDPLERFLWIIDEHGNEQSVYLTSLVSEAKRYIDLGPQQPGVGPPTRFRRRPAEVRVRTHARRAK
jgi:hypothetical protein